MLDSTSAAEKIGILSAISGTIVAAIQTLRWVGNFSREHEAFKAHLLRMEPLIERFLKVEEAVEVAERERAEMVDEVRGLREDINDWLKFMLQSRPKSR